MSDPSNDYRVSQEPPCEGCGIWHGGTQSRINCLSHHLRVVRAAHLSASVRVNELEQELAPILALREEVSKMGAAWPPDRK